MYVKLGEIQMSPFSDISRQNDFVIDLIKSK